MIRQLHSSDELVILVSSAGLFFNRRVRNPALRHLVNLGATSPDSAVPLSTLVEQSTLSERSIRSLVRANWISTTEDGLLYLAIAKIRQRSLRISIAQFVLLEVIMIIVTILIAFSPRVSMPPWLIVIIFVLLTLIATSCTYLEAWPYFHLN